MAACLGRCLLTKLHLLVEDRKQEEIFTKLTTFKNQYVLSVQYLVLPHLIPGDVG